MKNPFATFILFIFLVLCCCEKRTETIASTESPSVSQSSVQTATSDNQGESQTSALNSQEDAVTEGWDEQRALELFFSPDSIPPLQSQMFETVLLSTSSVDKSINTVNAFVQFISIDTSPEEKMYHQICPTIAVYILTAESGLMLASSYALECYTNYDDSFVDLNLSSLSLGDVEMIMLTATGSGGTSEEYSSETNTYLYALIDGELTQVLQVKTAESSSSEQSEEDNYERTWDLSLVDEKSETGLPNLVLSLTHASDEEGDGLGPVTTYHWTGIGFE